MCLQSNNSLSSSKILYRNHMHGVLSVKYCIAFLDLLFFCKFILWPRASLEFCILVKSHIEIFRTPAHYFSVPVENILNDVKNMFLKQNIFSKCRFIFNYRDFLSFSSIGKGIKKWPLYLSVSTMLWKYLWNFFL